MTVPRRTILAGLIGGWAARPALAADPRDLAFRVLRNDGAIGTHAVTFTGGPNALTVRVATDIKVGLGPITLYRYTHRAEEQWRDGVFIALDAETDDNGTIGRIRVRREAESLRVEGPKALSYQAPADALPLTHWNPAILKTPLISGQSGDLLRPAVRSVGIGRVVTAQGAIEADHYTMRGDPDLDTWYDGRSRWAGLRLTARDGSIIRYERL